MTPRKKILMLTTQLGYGGAETSFIRLANFLGQSMDVTVALFTRDYGSDSYASGHEPLNASIVLLDKPTVHHGIHRWLHRITQLKKLKQQHDATISFLSGPNLVNVLAGYRKRSIISLRGSRIYDPVAPMLQRAIFRYVLDPIMFHLAAHIVPVSAGFTNEIRHAAGMRAVAKISVISPFIERATLTHQLAAPPPAAYAALKGQKVIIAVGRLSVEKGFQHLIRVFHDVATQCSGAKLLLVGDGPMMPQLRAQCIQLGLPMDDTTPTTTSVLFAGYQKNPLPLMALSRVYALTSATEGFPNVVLEALAAGITVVAADTPWGARAILNDTPMVTAQPYPTVCATPTMYGVLMPRIDMPAYQTAWVHTLNHHLCAPHITNPNAIQRAYDYDVVTVGKQWLRLLQGMESMRG